MRRTRNAKVIATLCPASSDKETVRRLFAAGADVFRLNFSHGSAADHRAHAAAIVCYTSSGHTSLRAARERPEAPVLSLTTNLMHIATV